MTVADILARVVERRHDQDRARRSARTRLADYLRRVRLRAARPGSTCPGESPGSSFDASQTTPTPAWASMPIGYGIAVTAMQMLDVYTTIANDGDGAAAAAGRRRRSTPTASATTSRCRAPHQVVSAATADDGDRHAAEGGRPTGTGREGPDPRLHGGGQDGHRPEGALRHRRVQRVVRRVRAGRRPAAGGDRRDRRAPGRSNFGADAAAPVFQQIMQFALGYERVPHHRDGARTASGASRVAEPVPGTLTVPIP